MKRAKTKQKFSKASIFVALFLTLLSASIFKTTPASALQGIAIQEVNITVLPPEVKPEIPATGYNSTTTPPSQTDRAAPAFATGIAIVAELIIFAAVLYKLMSAKQTKSKKTAIIIPLIALCLVSTFVLLRSVSAVVADPTVELNPDIMNYSLYAGQSADLSFETTVTTDASSAGYTLSAISDDTNTDILLRIDSSDLDQPIDSPSIDIINPVVVYSSDNNAATGDMSKHTFTVSVSESIAPGEYKTIITYIVNTDDGESFIFSIDTRMTETLDDNPTHLDGTATTFAIPTSGYVGRDATQNYNWVIDWGDGSPLEASSGTSSDTSAGILHTYATPGEYQITIKSSGRVINGWLNAFGFYNTSTGANTQSNKNMFKSIDAPFTDAMRTIDTTYRFAYMFHGAHNAVDILPFLFDDIKTSYSTNVSNMFTSTFANYATNSTSATIPSGLFNSIHTTSATDASNMFNGTFFFCARNSKSATIPDGLFSSLDTSNAINVSNLFRDAFFGYASSSTSGTIPADLFSSIHLADGANAADSFGGTFYLYATDSTTGTIPSGLLSTIDTTNASSIIGMFSGTFSNYASASTVGSIPANLFSSIHTDNLTETAYLFNGTFSNYARNSNTTIPAGLFDAINTSKAVNLSSTFAGTFSNFANNSTSSTIPAGLFDAVSTSSADNLSNMFRDTFSNYAGLSTTATIPAGLFDAVNTSKAVNTPGMFSGTFYFFGHVSPAATIPANLFTHLDLSRATNVYEMFYRSFDSFAYEATAPTDINAIWGNANFAGRVTASNADSFFNSTFSNVTQLTGAAQTFIDAKLGGITPANPAHTFATTAVTDLATLPANWK